MFTNRGQVMECGAAVALWTGQKLSNIGVLDCENICCETRSFEEPKAPWPSLVI